MSIQLQVGLPQRASHRMSLGHYMEQFCRGLRSSGRTVPLESETPSKHGSHGMALDKIGRGGGESALRRPLTREESGVRRV